MKKTLKQRQPIVCCCFSVSLYTVTFMEKGNCLFLDRTAIRAQKAADIRMTRTTLSNKDPTCVAMTCGDRAFHFESTIQ